MKFPERANAPIRGRGNGRGPNRGARSQVPNHYEKARIRRPGLPQDIRTHFRSPTGIGVALILVVA